MSVEVNVVGMKCGMSCQYCYEVPVRGAQHNKSPETIDHAAIHAELERACGSEGFSLFGGEPLLARIEDIESLWSFGLERWGRNGVQTSGAPITDEHIALFKRYQVHVGFSIDGPGDLNDARRNGGIEQTRATTDHSIAMLKRCISEGVSCSLIVTLHRLNAGPEVLPRLIEWFHELDSFGLKWARLHLMELDARAREIALTPVENTQAMLAIREASRTMASLSFQEFSDIESKLRDPSASVTCIWNGCDPWTTTAVHGINADGSRSGCSRVYKDGRSWVPVEAPVRIRQAVLWQTEQKDGGCRGCRFFLQCGGQCPGTAIDGDWRMRSVDCPTWYALLERVETEMLERGESPASLATDLIQRIEAEVSAGLSPHHVSSTHADEHGDRAHGDEHGDHTDHGDHSDLGPFLDAIEGEEIKA